MKHRYIAVSLGAIVAASALTKAFVAGALAAENAVTISSAGPPSPTTCFFMVTPADPTVAGVTKWKVFVPRQNADPARHVNLPLRAQEIRPDQTWHAVNIYPDGEVRESGEVSTPATGPERETLSPLYRLLDKGCLRIGAGPG